MSDTLSSSPGVAYRSSLHAVPEDDKVFIPTGKFRTKPPPSRTRHRATPAKVSTALAPTKMLCQGTKMDGGLHREERSCEADCRRSLIAHSTMLGSNLCFSLSLLNIEIDLVYAKISFL